MVNNPLNKALFLGGVGIVGVPLDSHEHVPKPQSSYYVGALS